MYVWLDGNVISEESYKSQKEHFLEGIIRHLKNVAEFIPIMTNNNIENMSKENFIDRLEQLATDVGALDCYTIDLLHLENINE